MAVSLSLPPLQPTPLLGRDGSAAAGPLEEIFPFDMTRCGTRGRIEPMGAEMVHTNALGIVVHCGHVLLTIVHAGGRDWLEMQGVACLQITES